MKDLFLKRFNYYKELGDKTFVQLSDSELFWTYSSESNSIATLVQHISGNMESRWTRFLTEDGEKTWRNRDREFETHLKSKAEVIAVWEKGWDILFKALNQIEDHQWQKTILIRGEQHSVLDAVLRQLAHYPYHIGQIIYIAKMLKNDHWQILSIAKNQSENYTAQVLKNNNSEEIQENSSPVCFGKSDEIRDDYKL